jgi:hypothetical protein
MRTKYVLVFKLISLTNTSKGINQRWFRLYLKAGPLPEAPVVLFLELDRTV